MLAECGLRGGLHREPSDHHNRYLHYADYYSEDDGEADIDTVGSVTVRNLWMGVYTLSVWLQVCEQIWTELWAWGVGPLRAASSGETSFFGWSILRRWRRVRKIGPDRMVFFRSLMMMNDLKLERKACDVCLLFGARNNL